MAYDDQRALQEEAEARMMAQTSGLSEENANTNPEYMNSGPAVSGGNATESVTPVGNGANDSQSAGPDLTSDQGTPEDKINKMALGEMEQGLETSAEHVRNMPSDNSGALVDPELEAARVADKKRQVGKNMPSDPRSALEVERDKRLAKYDEMEKAGEITPRQNTKLKDRWKNIFNIIPEEDFGLVLMDFGFRAMMAGDTMGDMGALGAAGMGALGGVAARREADYQKDVSQFNMADEGARAALEEGRAEREGPDVLNTEQGVYQWNEKTKRYEVTKDKDTGEVLMPSALAGRPSVRASDMKAWADAFPDWSRQKLTIAAYSGISPQEALQEANRRFDVAFNRGAVLIPGKGRVRASNITDGDKKKFLDTDVAQYYGSEASAPALQNPNMSKGGWYKSKPKGMPDDEWNKYQDLKKQWEAEQ